MRTTQVTPGGIRVCGRKPLTDGELSAVDEVAELARRHLDARLAAMSPAERAEHDRRVSEGQERLRRLQRHARGAR